MKKALYLGIILTLLGCERRTDWEPQPITEEFIVVEGSVTDESKIQEVKLSRPVANLNVAPRPVSGAVVSISDGTTSWPLTEMDSLKGTYGTAGVVSGIPGRTYTLRIERADTVVIASDIMGPISALTPLKYASAGSGGMFQITWVASSYHPSNAAMYEILLDWSALPAYAGSDPEECKALLYYFTLTTIDVSDMFSPALEKITFPEGTIITERKVSLSKAHEEFIRCLLLETSWRGGLWDAIPANLPTNISGNNVGFFSASSVKTATMVVGH